MIIVRTTLVTNAIDVTVKAIKEYNSPGVRE
jgi:hypothetical protein